MQKIKQNLGPNHQNTQSDIARLSYLGDRLGEIQAELDQAKARDAADELARAPRVARAGRRLANVLRHARKDYPLSAATLAVQKRLNMATYWYYIAAQNVAPDGREDMNVSPAAPVDGVNYNDQPGMNAGEQPVDVHNHQSIKSMTPARVGALVNEIAPFTRHFVTPVYADPPHNKVLDDDGSRSLRFRDPDEKGTVDAYYGGSENMFGLQSQGSESMGSSMRMAEYIDNGGEEHAERYWQIWDTEVDPRTGAGKLTIHVLTSSKAGVADINMSLSRSRGEWNYDGGDHVISPGGRFDPVDADTAEFYITRLEHLVQAAHAAEDSAKPVEKM